MKRLFFVAGPESAGNRLTTRILCESGCFGGFDHYQILDEVIKGNKKLYDVIEESKLVAFRRSIPHGDEWADFGDVFNKFEEFDYKIIIPVRNLYELCKSKINNNGKTSILDAYDSVVKEMEYIARQIGNIKIYNNVFFFNVSFLFKCPDIMLDKLSEWSGLTIDKEKIKTFLYDADKNHMEESSC